MGKLAKVDQKIFGSSGGTTEFGQFGSDAAGAALTTKDLATIQALSQYLEGWYSATASASEPPRIEDMNSLFLMITTQLRYIFQTGIVEWDTNQDYYIGSQVQVAGVRYVSNTGTDGSPNQGNNPTTDIVNWAPTGHIAGDLYLSLVQDPSALGVRALILSGQVITAANYPALVANTYIKDTNNSNTAYQYFYKCSDALGATRSTAGPYYRLPDFRGVFLRGLDIGGTRNPNGTSDFLGNFRADAFQGHYQASLGGGFITQGVVGVPQYVGGTYGGWAASTGSPITDGTNGAPRTDKETRPMQGIIQIGIRY